MCALHKNFIVMHVLLKLHASMQKITMKLLVLFTDHR